MIPISTPVKLLWGLYNLILIQSKWHSYSCHVVELKSCLINFCTRLNMCAAVAQVVEWEVGR